ncbi:YdcF family protein [Neisseria wadsworthii]|uniref:YdcF family protein n=1 Tax=Neisseria wadsworthii TaxID=607711 RepID=UPI001F44AB60|nr:YdcF family protein [Neisseria wadsworthii]
MFSSPSSNKQPYRPYNDQNWPFQIMLLIVFAGALAWGAIVYYIYHLAQEAKKRTVQAIASADAIMVLGNAVNRNGAPNPCLRSRVEAGVSLYYADKAPMLLMSGGTDSDGSNEAEAMRDIALSLGVPAAHIRLENRSESTYENIAFSTPLLSGKDRIVLVSDGFHLARAEWLAAKQWPRKNIQSYSGAGCSEPDWQYTRKLIRESLAWAKALIVH